MDLSFNSFSYFHYVTSWYCDICDKTINIKNMSNHIKSKYHKHKEKFSVVVKEYEFIRLDVRNIDFISNICAQNCYINFFRTFKPKRIYDIEMTNGNIINAIIFNKKLEKLFQKMVLYIN